MKLMKDSNMNYDLDPNIVKAYAKKYQLTYQDAEQRLKKQYKLENTTIPTRDLAIKCIKSLREISPKFIGMETHVIRMNQEIKDLRYEVDYLKTHLKQFDNCNEKKPLPFYKRIINFFKKNK